MKKRELESIFNMFIDQSEESTPPEKNSPQRDYLLYLEKNFSQVRQTDTPNFAVVKRLLQEHEEALKSKPDEAIQRNKKRYVLLSTFVNFVCLGLESLEANSVGQDPGQLKKIFGSLKRKLQIERFVYNLILLEQKFNHSAKHQFLSTLSFEYLQENETRVIVQLIQARAKAIGFLFKQHAEKRRRPLGLEKAFNRWKLKTLREVSKWNIGKLQITKRISPEVVMWRWVYQIDFLKWKLNKDQKRRKLNFLFSILLKIKDRILLISKNNFLYSLEANKNEQRSFEKKKNYQRFEESVKKKMKQNWTQFHSALQEQNPFLLTFQRIEGAQRAKTGAVFSLLQLNLKGIQSNIYFEFFIVVQKHLKRNMDTLSLV